MTLTSDETQLQTNGPGGDVAVPRPRATELVTPEGKTTIADVVVSKIAGIAAREVPGVHELVGQGVGAAVSGIAQRVGRADARSAGVTVEVGEREAAVDFRLTVEYGISIPNLAVEVRSNVMDRLQTMTGLRVKEVNIDVVDLYFPEEEVPQRSERRVE
ncbi:MAG: Asp23/Gls24 family envelope stress response protein [Chloroflexi bacterium]|nr:Asp23/Gls24 family envelope stress response protein [Chloroflexota bacterium]